MEKITWFWNMVHYCIYLFFGNIFTLMNYLNPLTYVLKIKGVKRAYQERGINDMQQLTKSIANDPQRGINSIQSGGLMIGLIILLLFGIFNCSQLFFSKSLGDWIFESQSNEITFLLSLIIPSLLFNYFTLFKSNKYLDYFKNFAGMESASKTKYYWMSLFVVIFIVLFFIFSFKAT